MAATGLQRRKVEMLLDSVDRLPTLPGVAHQVLSLAMAEQPNPRRIQQFLESDAALAARAIESAARFARAAQPVTTIEDVLASLPADELTADLLTIRIVDAEALRHGRLQRLWEHNLATAMAAQTIAGRLGTVSPREAALAGLLHDIGLIALPVLMPKAFRQILDRMQADSRDPLEVEREVLGVDHTVVGKRLAQRWGLPASVQSAAWLHHQSSGAVPGPDAAVARIVHVADLIAQQEGYAFYPSPRVSESAAEAAERLGLSGAHAEQIAQQVAAALPANAASIGLEDEPTPGQLWHVVSRANLRLGALYRHLSGRRRRLETETRRADLLVRLNGRLAACRSTREILEAVSDTAREALGLHVVVPYVLGGPCEYIEGVFAGGPADGHFLYEVSKEQGLETLLADRPPARPGRALPMRAERIEAWLFDRQGPHLGEGPFYTVPMLVEDAKVGGLVFSLPPSRRDLTDQEAGELAALASMAGVALKRAQAESDLTALSEELAEVNRELQLAQEDQLQRRNVAAVSEMAAGAAHEINNPLAVISGRAQQLLADEKDAQRRGLLESIVHQAARVSDILRELREFARPPAPVRQDCCPSDLARQVAGALGQEAAASGVQLSVEAPPEVPPIRVDPGQVAGALSEIVRNAVEACAGGGQVTLMVRPLVSDGLVRLSVVDTGPGMRPEDRARALDPFFSGREAGRHRGLGLPRAFRAIQANGGQMTLDSKTGQGTTVRVTFRAAPGADAGPAPPGRSPASPGQSPPAPDATPDSDEGQRPSADASDDEGR
jgi:signal transduction histidine kinase/HD-like signal output (HDOD) protein